MNGRRGNPGLKGRLVAKSLEAYILSLETINRLSILYRMETFTYLLCNAWELLLKAKILEDTGQRSAIYQKVKSGEYKKSLPLSDCLNRVMPNAVDPVRKNIERVIELRNESTHLVISHIPLDVISLFQASVINYHNSLKNWFGISLSDRIPVGMMSLVYDFDPEKTDLNNKRLRRELGKDSANYLSHYCAQLKQDFEDLQGSAVFSVGIDYRLVLTKKQNEGDITLSSGSSTEKFTRIIEIPKDPSKSHPFRRKEVIDLMLKKLGLVVNQHEIQSVINFYQIKKKPEFFYKGDVPGSPSQYSQALVDWLINKYQVDQQFFFNASKAAKKKK